MHMPPRTRFAPSAAEHEGCDDPAALVAGFDVVDVATLGRAELDGAVRLAQVGADGIAVFEEDEVLAAVRAG